MWAVLGRSRGLCWLTWAALKASVGGLGSLLGPMLTVWGRLEAKSGPNPSGKAIWQGDQAGKWPKPERESDPKGVGPPEPPEVSEGPEAQYLFFL